MPITSQPQAARSGAGTAQDIPGAAGVTGNISNPAATPASQPYAQGRGAFVTDTLDEPVSTTIVSRR